VEIALKDPDATQDVKSQLRQIFGPAYLIQNKYQQNKSLYSVMNMERWVIYAIACLILMVAAFNMIGALRMLSLEKQKDIAALHAMGANSWFIQKIFLSEGFLLAIIGGLVGMTLAALIAVLQIKFHLIPLTGGSFLIDYFPVKLNPMDFLLVGATIFVIALIASWMPSEESCGPGILTTK
jgi:lipoprotein-releasing system permease protein